MKRILTFTLHMIYIYLETSEESHEHKGNKYVVKLKKKKY